VGPCSEIRWSLGENLILAKFVENGGYLALFNTEEGKEIMNFEKQQN
jgi:hypothetical protein